ncbi:MAG: sensor histidine kinase [Actinomycetota bacterium]|nr:sensor histidine kinase [Actinomycetota bacterium]
MPDWPAVGEDSNGGERRRVARELHDKVAHSLGVALNSLELHEAYLERDPSRARRELRVARHAVRGALRHVQELSADLRGRAVLGSVDHALRDYLRMVASPAVDWSVTVRGDERTLDPDLRDDLYLILREAARNALIHSAARHLVITVAVRADAVHGTVTDDGHGFDPGSHPASGGLTAMRERAESHGGSLTVSSTTGAGTVVQVHVPTGRREDIAPDQP